MNKTVNKIASVIIASSMLLAAAPVNADTTYDANALQAKIAENFDGYNAETKTASLILDADTDVSKAGKNNYADKYISTSTTQAKSATLTGDFKSTLDMSKVRKAFAAYQEAAKTLPAGTETMLSLVPVTGQFVISVVYDSRMAMSDEAIAYHTATGLMNGFNEEAKRIFVDTKREIKDGAVMADGTVKATDGYKTLLITVDVKAPEGEYASALKSGNYVNMLCYADLAEHADALLGDIEYTVDTVTVTKAENEAVPQYYTVSITMDGEIKIGNALSTIDFSTQQLADNANNYAGVEDWQDVSASMAVIKTSTGGGGGGGSTTATTPTPKPVATATPIPGEATATPVPGEATADPNATMDPSTPSSTIPPYTPADNKVPSVLNGDDHFVYIIGYPEGDVRPEGNITREEVATIFYRILKDEYRDTVYTKNHNYSDVELSRWSNKAIATLTNGGFIQGYGDDGNTFKPAGDMTRLEFIVMATNFLDESDSEVKYLDDVKFTDVPERLSWGQEALQKAAIAELIDEDERTDFRPEDKIKRHEAMKIINRLLVRNVKEDGLIDGYVQWPDNSPEAKYYYEVIEATNSHTFERLEDGYEKWTSVNQNWIWGDFKTKYEDPDAEDLQ